MASPQTGTVDDLATLSELTESMLLDEIEARYQKGIIYTYIGDILLAVNPYKKLDIFSPEVLKMYSHVTLKRQQPPHIFSISDWSYANMYRSGMNQCCVVCGESGSGKTETTKLLIRHIVEICDQQSNGLLNKIIEINPLLEAFGNARTVMNNNSSRFGKYIELQFDLEGKINGANVSDYLLEKSRVIQQAPGERNFHIFYYMFAGLDLKKLQINLLSKPEDHRILKPSDGSNVFGESDSSFSQAVDMWKKTQRIMDLVGFSSDEKESITAMLTAVIHITDIRFLHDPDTDGSYIENEERLDMAAILLGVEVDQLGAALTTTETTIPGQTEKIVILKNIYQAADGRDALAKTLYGRMFAWIVRQINHILGPVRASTQPQDTPGSVQMPSIGILDIYGFENFKTNSFEQLCINIANEQIHFYFTQHIFKMELDEYSLEGIKGKNVQFDDNRHIVELFFEANGLYDLLDEESKFPRANDLTLIEKLEKTFLKRPEFERPRTQNLQFVIQHYAGPVSYCVSGFLEKNRDLLSVNLLDCMKKSGSLFVADLFLASISDTGSLNENDPRPSTSRRTVKSILLCQPLVKRGAKESRTKKIVKDKSVKRPTSEENRGSISKTLSGYFKNSLAKLLEKMTSAEPHFVRCIRPNAMKQPDTFNKELVLKQLRYTGVVQTVTIRRQGYAIRLSFNDFLKRYKFIAFPFVSQVEPGPNNCRRVLSLAGIEKYEIGKTKVFLKYYHTEQLDAVMLSSISKVVTFQKYSRGLLARKLYEGMLAEKASQLSSMCDCVSQLSSSTAETLQKLHKFDKEQNRPDPPKVPPRTSDVPSRNSSANNSALEIMLEEAMSTLHDVDITFWGKLHFLSNNTVAQKFLLRDFHIILDGSNTQYNGTTIGLTAHASDYICQEALQEIGKGVEITKDEAGDVFMKKLGSCDIIIKGYRDEKNNCLPDEVVKACGRLGSNRMRVFDIQKFKKHIATELRQAVINIPRIEKLSIIGFSFICSKVSLDVSIAIINFSALDLLGDLQILTELKQMAGLRLSQGDDLYLQNTWQQMRRRKPGVEQVKLDRRQGNRQGNSRLSWQSEQL